MPKTLLLADDSVTIQKVVGISFANEDITITTVDNGDDAIAKARELRPDVILADVVMPGKSGYDVCEAVKADPDLRRTPVLLLTGTFEAFDEERAARAGAAGHVAKPFEAQTLVERVKELLAEAAAAPPPPVPPAAAPPQPPPTAVEAPTNPELGSSDQAFDFFDDSPRELSEPQAGGAVEEDALDLDEPDAAFAFGDEELSPTAQEPAPAAPLRARDEAPDATVAILPDEAPSPAGGASDEALELAFDRAGDGPVARPASAPVESDDLAQATLLDPALGSGFDVSSSDLAREEEPAAPPAPAPPASPPPPPAPPARPLSAFDRPGAPPAPPPSLPRDPVMDRLAPEPEPAFPGPAGSPAEAPRPASPPPPAAHTPADSWNAEPPPGMPRPFGAEDAPEAPPYEAAEEASVWPEEPEGADDGEPLELEPEPEPAPRPPARAPERAQPQTPLSPAMREELDAMLEKVAWDAFGQVTEKIVADALQRIEQVAWEVIPKLAESLIQEEIRRLKEGGSE